MPVAADARQKRKRAVRLGRVEVERVDAGVRWTTAKPRSRS